MRQVKVIFLALEVAALLTVIILAFSEVEPGEAQLFKSVFIAILPLFAVAMQAEYQEISWDGEDEEEL